MFNWVKKMFGAGAKEQKWIAKPKVEVKKNMTNPIVVKPSFKNKKDLAKLTKVKLEEIGRTYGIELDRRERKDKLINQLWKAIKK
tara:strand:+ start:1469 stop:1723 length:255 start_codon:yes stop_codon:yes gene_type:complete